MELQARGAPPISLDCLSATLDSLEVPNGASGVAQVVHHGLPLHEGPVPLLGAHGAAAEIILEHLDEGSTSLEGAVSKLVRKDLVEAFVWRFLHSACVLARPPLIYGLLQYVAHALAFAECSECTVPSFTLTF